MPVIEMSREKKLTQMWSNQTNLGKKFGLSAIAVGKLLVGERLKDPTTKLATKKALEEGYAKSTPLKDGTPYFMWSINKICPLIEKDYQPLSKVDYWVKEVMGILKEAQALDDAGNDKLGRIMSECAYEDVPKNILEEVKARVETLVPIF